VQPEKALSSHALAEDLEVLSFKRLDPSATLPARGSSHAAGLDLHSIAEVTLEPGQRSLVATGLAASIPVGYYGRVAPRSGLATKQGLDVMAGVIDADYRGEILCLLYNAGEDRIVLSAQTKICQLIIEKIITPTAVWSDEISETERGDGGFGSTG
jgi:dUTP pyrophosphatase